MFKIRMQGQYGGQGDKRLSAVVGDMWRQYGFRDGIMRGFWVRFPFRVADTRLTQRR
jgi:solute carrier family 25 carnitine/acylcarnitine transporter 20/29